MDKIVAMKPLISVVMPVYNCDKFIGDAIKSILNQSIDDFEFVILNDASFDKTLEFVKGYTDKRIKLYDFKSHQGMVNLLNKGIDVASGRYVARMDGDDISLNRRFELQIKTLEERQAHVCGCHYYIINEFNKIMDTFIAPLHEYSIPFYLSFTVPFAHGSVLMDKEFIDLHKMRYGQTKYHYSEDYQLWLQFFKNDAVFANCNEFLFKYRDYRLSYSKTKIRDTKREGYKVAKEFILTHKNNLEGLLNQIVIADLSEQEKATIVASIILQFYFCHNLKGLKYAIKIGIRYFRKGVLNFISNFIIKRIFA